MSRRRPCRARWWRIAAAVVVTGSVHTVVTQSPASAASGQLKGSGSTYVGLAMQQWVSDGSEIGVRVDYQPVGSPDGLNQFGQGLIDFAATEAEYSGLAASDGSNAAAEARGYQYVPDVAGAIAVMYNATDTAGRKIDYLRLSPVTIARIFMGKITRWDDPAIAADNAEANLRLPAEPITVVYRSGKSGTTALFYDFVANVAPGEFAEWAGANGFPDNRRARIVELDKSGQRFAPKTLAQGNSDLIAKHIASNAGRWSIGYDEFGYAKTYGTTVARVRNASGQWQLPYATNISAALESADLRPDLTQELSRVYASADPQSYPISAYSYLVTQCPPAGDRPTCKGGYADQGTADTLAKWMRMIACDGQREMAQVGYSPLPPHLSQEMANSIGRMLGRAPERLNAGNCGNPRFRGNDFGAGAVAPPDPVVQRRQQNGPAGAATTGPGGPAAGSPTESTTAGSTAPGSGSGPDGGEESAADPLARQTARVGGGSTDYRDAEPVAYTRPIERAWTLWPVAVLLALIVAPAAVGASRRLTSN